MQPPTSGSAPDSPFETELRLGFAAADAAGLRAALETIANEAPADAPRPRPQTRRLRTVYFDTASGALREARAVLRVRSIGRSRRQTLKAAGGADALSRLEWEMPIQGDLPDPAAFLDPRARDILAAVDGPLAEVFETRVRRETRRLAVANSVVDAAIDEGTIVAGSRIRPIRELELELVEGEPWVLWSIASRVEETVPLRIEPAAKSDRADMLAFDRPPAPVRDTDVPLDLDISADDALLAILRQCLAQALGNLPAASDGRDSGGVHQLRVGLRRLRSVLWLVGKLAPSAKIEAFRDEAKRLAGSAGPPREWDVFLSTTLPPIATAVPEPDWSALRRATEAERARAYDEVGAALGDRRLTSFVLSLGLWIEQRGWRLDVPTETLATLSSPAIDLARDALDGAHKRVLKAGRNMAELDAEHRHKVRIRLKRLRYLVSAFAPLFGDAKVKRFGRTLSKLQDRFGQMNDAVATASLMERLTSGSGDPALHRAAGIVAGWVGYDRVAEDPKLLADWERFADAKPFWS
jgi:inorganic triphosphatase YgiF